MAKELFDDGVTRTSARRAEPATAEEQEGVPIRSITEAGLNRMARQKQEINTQAVHALKEIEELRRRQEQLEKEKSSLEDLTRRQDEYESGKLDIMEKLRRGLVLLEKEEVAATRMAELLSVMRRRFHDTLNELHGIEEAAWADDKYEVEMNKAFLLVEDAQAVYKKALAKIDAENWDKGGADRVRSGRLQKAVASEFEERRSFSEWLKAGAAFSLPFTVVALLILAIYVLLTLAGIVT